jgi:hypothetical protein
VNVKMGAGVSVGDGVFVGRIVAVSVGAAIGNWVAAAWTTAVGAGAVGLQPTIITMKTKIRLTV